MWTRPETFLNELWTDCGSTFLGPHARRREQPRMSRNKSWHPSLDAGLAWFFFNPEHLHHDPGVNGRRLRSFFHEFLSEDSVPNLTSVVWVTATYKSVQSVLLFFIITIKKSRTSNPQCFSLEDLRWKRPNLEWSLEEGGKIETNEKKRSEKRKHCSLAVVRRNQKISPRRRPPFRGRGTAKI